jgi:hypothetical protein
MDWYTSLFSDERMRATDPFGYGVGLAFGYVLVPLVLLGLIGVVLWHLTRK